jgi:hypothetical protein
MLGIFAMSKEAPPYGLIKPNWNKAQKKRTQCLNLTMNGD